MLIKTIWQHWPELPEADADEAHLERLPGGSVVVALQAEDQRVGADRHVSPRARHERVPGYRRWVVRSVLEDLPEGSKSVE